MRVLQNKSPTKQESYEMRVQLQIEVITHNPKMEFEILNMVYINFTGVLDVKTNQFLDRNTSSETLSQTGWISCGPSSTGLLTTGY